MTTWLNCIEDAMGLLQVLNPGALTARETQDGMRRLRAMLESWANDPLNIYTITQENFTAIGDRVMTMGPGGDWDTVRPIRLYQVTAQIADGLDRPMIILNAEDYAQIKLKNLSVNYPQYIYADGAYPLQNIAIYPVPADSMTLTIWSYKPIASPINPTDEVTLPPGYLDAIVYNLAMRLAPMFQVTAGADVGRIATTSLKAIQRTNTRVPTQRVDIALTGQRGGRYNIFTDSFGPGWN